MKGKKEAREHRVKESKIKGNSLGASGFTLGIISVLSLGIVGTVLAILGFIFCWFQQTRKPTRLGKAGIIINIIGFILGLFWIFYLGPKISEMILSTFPSA